jgi:hypothetical protein
MMQHTPIPWPEQLRDILAALALETRQDWHEFRTDSGHVKRRAKTTPYPVLTGMVRVDEATKRALDAFVGHSFGLPLDLGQSAPAKLATFHSAPFVHRTTVNVGADTWHEVELTLRVLSPPAAA